MPITDNDDHQLRRLKPTAQSGGIDGHNARLERATDQKGSGHPHAADAPGSARQHSKRGTSLGPESAELAEQNDGYWGSRSPDERQAYITQLDANYHAIVNDFLKLASASVDEFRNMTAGHLKSRRQMIWATGGLAALNILVTFVTSQTDRHLRVIAIFLPVATAVYAAFLAILSNLESLENYLSRAQHYRQARETSLNAFRELEMLWHVYVRPFSDTPVACVNAANLYRRAVAKDQEVRGQIMEKTSPRSEPS